MHIEIIVNAQTLTLHAEERTLMSFPVATASKGVGEQNGSEQTPRGWHYVRAKIGSDQPVNTVFVGRRATGEIYTPSLKALAPEYYNHLHAHRSWTRVLFQFLFDKKLDLYARITRVRPVDRRAGRDPAAA